MTFVSTAYEEIGRVAQKRRTRAAVVDAARDLMAAGVTPTVEEAAASAGVSRTTAYRYFPNQRTLLVTAFPELDRPSLLEPEVVTDDPAERLAAVVDTVTQQVLNHEAQLRTTLRLSLEATPEERARLVLRQGRAIGWLEEALAPVRGEISDAELRRLVLALRTTIGIEALVWLTDVAGLSRSEARDVMRWSAQTLLSGAIASRTKDSRRDGASSSLAWTAAGDAATSEIAQRARRDSNAQPSDP